MPEHDTARTSPSTPAPPADTAEAPVPEKERRAVDFPVRIPMDTRWSDNDVFGHLNNAVYYQLFDSAINRWTIETANVSPLTADAQPLVAESGCRFFREVRFPDPLSVGISIARLGNSSVTYRLGLFTDQNSDDAVVAAVADWVHVYVDTTTRRPTLIPAAVREVLESAVQRQTKR